MTSVFYRIDRMSSFCFGVSSVRSGTTLIHLELSGETLSIDDNTWRGTCWEDSSMPKFWSKSQLTHLFNYLKSPEFQIGKKIGYVVMTYIGVRLVIKGTKIIIKSCRALVNTPTPV